jgi:hypothetical protein
MYNQAIRVYYIFNLRLILQATTHQSRIVPLRTPMVRPTTLPLTTRHQRDRTIYLHLMNVSLHWWYSQKEGPTYVVPLASGHAIEERSKSLLYLLVGERRVGVRVRD